MATAFQELVTRLILDPQAYKEGGEQVKRVTHEIKEQIEEMSLKAREAVAGTFERFKVGEILAPLAAMATAGGVLELGKHSLEVARDFDVLQRRIEGVVHSAERARKVMEFGESQSGLFGMFKPEELDDVAAVLEALNLKTETFLPTVQKLALVMGGGAGEMREFAEALGLIAQGESGRALRVLERAGISTQLLMKHGVAFNGPREIASSPTQTVRGINAAIEDKFGGEMKQFDNGPEAVSQRLSNAYDQAFRKAGMAIQTFFLPYMEKATKVVSELVENGKVERIAKGFMSLFSMDTHSLEGAIQRVANVLEEVPNKIRRIQDFWKEFSGYFLGTIKLMTAAWFGMWAAGAIGTVVSAIGRVAVALKGLTILEGIQFAFMLGMEALKKNIVGVLAAIALTAGAFYGLSKIMDSISGIGEPGDGDTFRTPKAPSFKDSKDKSDLGFTDPNTQYLQQISVNTGAMAKDMRKYALGGGDLGHIGVSPIELSRMRHSSSAGRAMQRVVVALEDLLSEHAADHTGQMMRQGIISQ